MQTADCNLLVIFERFTIKNRQLYSSIGNVETKVWIAQETWPVRKSEFFIERRMKGDYAVRDGGATRRARAVCHTQAEAIAKARQIDPDAAILVERVRNTDKGHPDKWRKP